MSKTIKDFFSSTKGIARKMKGWDFFPFPTSTHKALLAAIHSWKQSAHSAGFTGRVGSRNEAAQPHSLLLWLRLCKYIPWSLKPHMLDTVHPLLHGIVFLKPFPKPTKFLGHLQGENTGFTSLNSKNKCIYSYTFAPELYLDVWWGNIPVVS